MSKPTVHLICNAHLDPVWQWRWEEGCAAALSTFAAAGRLLHEHPGFIFNHNEAVLYRWVRQYDPALFREIRRFVAAGRWCIAGGWFLQPDVNLPGLESLLRQVAHGRRFFAEHFNVRPHVAYNLDSFGHGGGLPQVLRECGYDMYIHLRPGPEDLPLPADLYRWRGVDGSQVTALRIVVGYYHTERDNIEQRVGEGVEMALRLNRDVPVFWGLGDHGGGATREDLDRIDACIAAEGRVHIEHSTTERLYEALREAAATAPVFDGDLQRVNTGCYTSLSRIKRRARSGAAGLAQAEALCAAAWWARNATYPAELLEEAWRAHLFNDFHDILPGSCTAPAEQDALDLYGHASEMLRRARLGSAVAMAAGEHPCPTLPLVVQNANPTACRVPVELECMVDARPLWTGTWHLRLFSHDGREVICQEEQAEALLPFNNWRRKVCFVDRLPALGSAHYRVELEPGPPPPAPAWQPALPHRLDPLHGRLSAVELDGENLLSEPAPRPLVVSDPGDAWGYLVWEYRDVVGRFESTGPARVVEVGPIRTVHETLMTCGPSRLILHAIAYRDWPALELRLRVHWNEERKMLKLAFPTRLLADTVRAEIAGGTIRRPADGQEHVHGRWLMMEGEVAGRPAAVGIVNSGQHGFDALDGELRLSVLRSPAYCHERNFRLDASRAWRFMDQGVHDVRLLLTAGSPDDVLRRLPGLADWLDAPPAALAHLPIGAPAAVPRQEVLSLAPETVRLVACKRSDDGTALIVRLHETVGRPAEAVLHLATPARDIRRPLRPFEFATIRVERDGTWCEVPAVEEA
jgi:alpha-mannosidase